MSAAPGSYYSDLTKSLDEWVVDRLWGAILNIYFTAAEDFGVEIQPRPAPTQRKMANDVTVAYVHHASNRRKALCLIEDKRVKFEGQGAVWTEAKEKLIEYMHMQRHGTKQKSETMYGVVTVGRYSRFYVMLGPRDDLDPYPGTNDAYFEFKKDEAAIIEILLQIKATVPRLLAPAGETSSRLGSRGSGAVSRPGSRGSSVTSCPRSSGSGGASRPGSSGKGAAGKA